MMNPEEIVEVIEIADTESSIEDENIFNEEGNELGNFYVLPEIPIFVSDENFEKWKKIAEVFSERWLMKLINGTERIIFSEAEITNSAFNCLEGLEKEDRPSCIQIQYSLEHLKNKFPEKIRVIDHLEKWFYYQKVPTLINRDFGNYLEKIKAKEETKQLRISKQIQEAIENKKQKKKEKEKPGKNKQRKH